MATTTQRWTVNAIKEAVRATGSHWFDPDTMSFFGTKVLPAVYQGPGGIYFVTSDHDYQRRRGFTVRKFSPETNDVDTVGEVAGYDRPGAIQQAKLLAIRMAGTERLVDPEAGGVPYEARGLEVIEEPFEPVTVLEQFLTDLRKHGNPEATTNNAVRLINFAARHHRLMEDACNGARVYDDQGECEPLPRLASLRSAIREEAAQCGAKPQFQGDPRGVTVKLIFKDGYTNDLGHTGYCVPTSQKLD